MRRTKAHAQASAAGAPNEGSGIGGRQQAGGRQEREPAGGRKAAGGSAPWLAGWLARR